LLLRGVQFGATLAAGRNSDHQLLMFEAKPCGVSSHDYQAGFNLIPKSLLRQPSIRGSLPGGGEPFLVVNIHLPQCWSGM